MRKLMIRLIEKYQDVSRHRNPTCRFYPTCSQYGKEAFQKHNFFYASFLTIKRIIKCNPLNKGGYDPVPKKRKKDEDDR